MRSNSLVAFIFLTLLLMGCSKGVDDEALDNLSKGLEDRWNFADTLGDKIDLDDYETAISKEMGALKKYDSDEFKDVSLYILYDEYVRELNNGMHILDLSSSTDDLYRDWNTHVTSRAENLKEIESEYGIPVADDYKDLLEELMELADAPREKGYDTDITETATLNYMEQITFRYFNSSELDNNSFEQKSELNACLGRVDSITKELKEDYPEDPLALMIIDLGETVKVGCQDKLDGKHELDYDNSFEIGQHIGIISETYMNGELPPTAQFMIQ